MRIQRGPTAQQANDFRLSNVERCYKCGSQNQTLVRLAEDGKNRTGNTIRVCTNTHCTLYWDPAKLKNWVPLQN